MTNVKEVIKGIAGEIGVPEKSAIVYGRKAREAGLLSQGGRGVNAIDATAEDAANLLIALIACPRPARAPEYIQDFGDLIADHVVVTSDNIAQHLFEEGQTFRKGIASLISALGKPSFAKAVKSELVHVPGTQQYMPPHFHLTISDTRLFGSVRFMGNEAKYAHKSVAKLANGANQETIKSALNESNSVVRKYFRGVTSIKSIDEAILIPVAELVNGISFSNLLEKA